MVRVRVTVTVMVKVRVRVRVTVTVMVKIRTYIVNISPFISVRVWVLAVLILRKTL